MTSGRVRFILIDKESLLALLHCLNDTKQDMNNTWSEDLWKKTVYAIWDRSCNEPGFREHCVHNAREVIEQIAGVELPEDVAISFDASSDAANMPKYKDVFENGKPTVLLLPMTQTKVSVTAR